MSDNRDSTAKPNATQVPLEARVSKLEELAERPNSLRAGLKSPVIIAALLGAVGTLIGGLGGMYLERKRLETNAILQATNSPGNDDKINNLCALDTMGVFSSERSRLVNEIVKKRTGANCP